MHHSCPVTNYERASPHVHNNNEFLDPLSIEGRQACYHGDVYQVMRDTLLAILSGVNDDLLTRAQTIATNLKHTVQGSFTRDFVLDESRRLKHTHPETHVCNHHLF